LIEYVKITLNLNYWKQTFSRWISVSIGINRVIEILFSTLITGIAFFKM